MGFRIQLFCTGGKRISGFKRIFRFRVKDSRLPPAPVRAESAEQQIECRQQFRRRAVVVYHFKRRNAQIVRQFIEHRYVCAAELVNRLLFVSDKKKFILYELIFERLPNCIGLLRKRRNIR